MCGHLSMFDKKIDSNLTLSKSNSNGIFGLLQCQKMTMLLNWCNVILTSLFIIKYRIKCIEYLNISDELRKFDKVISYAKFGTKFSERFAQLLGYVC